jgi:hypothetical protein
MGYYMTRAQAEALAQQDRHYLAEPRPDRHGDHTNGFQPRPDTWGVWDNQSCHWVFVDVDGDSQ